jgi:hypothetical protein
MVLGLDVTFTGAGGEAGALDVWDRSRGLSAGFGLEALDTVLRDDEDVALALALRVASSRWERILYRLLGYRFTMRSKISRASSLSARRPDHWKSPKYSLPLMKRPAAAQGPLGSFK